MTEPTTTVNKNDDDLYNTDYQVGQDNVNFLGLDFHNPVFPISAIMVVVFVLGVLIFRDQAADFFGWLRPAITQSFDWFFVISANLFLIFCLVLAILPVGKIRLGGEEATPDYSYPAWFAMLFSAGVGIGLMFYGVLEPMNHTLTPPLGLEAGSDDARSIGTAAAIFHWGFHAWAIYAVVGLALAFFHYNKDLPLTLRSAFYPLLGDRVWGLWGHIIDIMAVLATLFGLATSLGIGANQIAAGLNYLFGIDSGIETKSILILAITIAALVSVYRGMDGGVKRLSEINMVMAAMLMVFVMVVGPTALIFSGIVSNTVDYLSWLPALSNWVGREDSGFYHGWTTFYWAWWVSWSPFVGMFIARVSRGRTVREFILAVLIAPTIVCIVWMTTFGTTALDQMDGGYMGVVNLITNGNWQPELSIYKMFEALPFTAVISFFGMVLTIIFFVTSSDSGSLVIDTITAGGKIDAPVSQRIFWCTIEGLAAIALLMGGGLGALQAATISTGLPFAVFLLVMCVSLYIGLSRELRRKQFA
ncbi:BCCT family transporter [Grimontia sp. SpTr1]|uniref:BCCT family transporter n=1 Tax=Grimontia sp. SpTr1 TaxID=2995319 RepID=UPI00248B6B46|nr:BCCT family transporter [Grimontia sp. SpTr1]